MCAKKRLLANLQAHTPLAEYLDGGGVSMRQCNVLIHILAFDK